MGDGEVGELVIGGVGLARYLDEAKDAEKYAPMPTLGWRRAYRSGDLVQLESEGLIFFGRADDQVKIGGRRIELGEIDTALVHLPGVSGGAAAVRRTAAGNPVLVGYVASADPEFDISPRAPSSPSSFPPRWCRALALLDELPTRTSGKVDRDALPWPLPGGTETPKRTPELTVPRNGLRDCGIRLLGATVTGPGADFFDLGGGSLSAAQLVAALRERYPQVTVADLYDHPRLGSLAGFLDEPRHRRPVIERDGETRPRVFAVAQTCCRVPLATLAGLQWVTWLGVRNAARPARCPGAVDRRCELVAGCGGVRRVRHAHRPDGDRGVGRAAAAPGRAAGHLPPRRRVHLRVWLAERLAEASGAENLAGAPWMVPFARALGANIGKGVDLHSLPPVTGMLELGDRCSIEPEVDLAGHWIDGDLSRRRHPGRRGRGDRLALDPAARRRRRQERRRGSGLRVFGKVKGRAVVGGSPAVKVR